MYIYIIFCHIKNKEKKIKTKKNTVPPDLNPFQISRTPYLSEGALRCVKNILVHTQKETIVSSTVGIQRRKKK